MLLVDFNPPSKATSSGNLLRTGAAAKQQASGYVTLSKVIAAPPVLDGNGRGED